MQGDLPLPILLGVQREHERLTLTVDLDPTSADPASESVLTMRLTLAGREPHKGEIALLAANLGAVLEWEDDGGDGIAFQIDYARELAAIGFVGREELRSTPDADVLHARTRRLAALLAEAEERHWSAAVRHRALVEAIARELAREGDRARRKLPFLRGRKSPASHREEGRLAALARLEAILQAHQRRDG
jgi:hypothetical protein